MKLNKTHLFIAVSSVALAAVLAIQVDWMLRTAKIKEELFNEKANMVLSKTADALAAGGHTGTHAIDSLLTYYMAVYDIRIDYYFEVKPTPFLAARTGPASHAYLDPAGTYQTCIGETPGKNALELKLVFPKKEQFIRAEMGTPFIASVMLVILVLVMSWRTILSLLKEKRISEHSADFLNNMTHEFKTPLTNIALAGKMITKETNITHEDKIRHYSGIILEENEKLRLQVEQVLGMTALERGEIPLRRTELDMHRLLRDVLREMEMQTEHRQGSVTLQTEAAHFQVKGDRTHLTNVFCNLVDNALKYSAGNPRLTIRTYDDGPHWAVAVSDRGIGIEKEYRKRVFDAFFRVPTGDVHDVKGFGLGLAYIKKMVELHGGTVTLQSEKGKGTTFTVTLPHA